MSEDGEEEKKVNWLDLPEDLLLLTVKKLVILVDYVRFGAVCGSWQRIYAKNLHDSYPRQVPLLVYATESDVEDQTRRFYNISQHKVCGIKVQINHEDYCIGSSHGWLVVEKNSEFVSLLNPFLHGDNVIELPPITKFIKQPADPENCCLHFSKVILTANPTVSNDYVVVAIYGEDGRLAYFKPGKTTLWTSVVEPDLVGFRDLLYCNNILYILNWLGQLLKCDINSHTPKIEYLLKEPPVAKYKGLVKRYLVESQGELFQVHRQSRKRTENKTINFEIFKFDQDWVEWSKVYDLCGETCFIGWNSSISLSPGVVPNIKKNCIYFTDDHDECPSSVPDRLYDLGVCNLEYGIIEPYFPIKCTKEFPYPIWIQQMSNGT